MSDSRRAKRRPRITRAWSGTNTTMIDMPTSADTPSARMRRLAATAIWRSDDHEKCTHAHAVSTIDASTDIMLTIWPVLIWARAAGDRRKLFRYRAVISAVRHRRPTP